MNILKDIFKSFPAIAEPSPQNFGFLKHFGGALFSEKHSQGNPPLESDVIYELSLVAMASNMVSALRAKVSRINSKLATQT